MLFEFRALMKFFNEIFIDFLWNFHINKNCGFTMHTYILAGHSRARAVLFLLMPRMPEIQVYNKCISSAKYNDLLSLCMFTIINILYFHRVLEPHSTRWNLATLANICPTLQSMHSADRNIQLILNSSIQTHCVSKYWDYIINDCNLVTGPRNYASFFTK